MFQCLKRLLCVVLIAGLAACGGGGGSDETQSFTVSIFAYNGGAVTPTQVQVTRGQSAEFQVTPDKGFRIQSVSGCNAVLSGQNYRTGPITANCTVNVGFEPYIAAPGNIQAEAGDGQVTFSWDSVNGAEAYHLYYDTEAGITPDNFTMLENGTWVAQVSSPYVLTGLENYTSYYATISATLGEHESPWTQQVVARPQAPFSSVGGLNDTGLNSCLADNELVNECPAVGFPGQDGEHGRDALARAGQLQKIGGGRAGFDFTKLGANGEVLPIQHQSWNEQGNEADGTRWSCVRDNVTGLIWEVKVNNPNHLQHWEHSYSWYNPDSTTNGGDAGVQNDGVCLWSQIECDTQAYVQAINENGLCGAQNWRLPNRQELLSIIDHNVILADQTNPGSILPEAAVDTDYFPNMVFDWSRTQYWSSSSSANWLYGRHQSEQAWFVDFAFATPVTSNKGWDYQLILVRSGSEIR